MFAKPEDDPDEPEVTEPDESSWSTSVSSDDDTGERGRLMAEEIQLQKGDLVDCTFHAARNWGVIEDISDGSERGFPGELMYLVRIQGFQSEQPIWLHRFEILEVIDPEVAMADMAKDYLYFQQVEEWYNGKFGVRRKAWNELVHKVAQEAVSNFRGVL